MTIDVQIQCINKTPRNDPHDRIKNVGGINPGGKRWLLTQPDAIAGIEDKRWRFWTHANKKSVWVVVATSRWGHKYLKTEADGDQPDNLLSLPECPP